MKKLKKGIVTYVILFFATIAYADGCEERKKDCVNAFRLDQASCNNSASYDVCMKHAEDAFLSCTKDLNC